MAKDAQLGFGAIQAESTFNGTGSGSLYRLPGAVRFEWGVNPVHRLRKVNVWRMEDTEAQAGLTYEGNLEMELHSARSMNLMLEGILAPISALGGTPATYTYRPPRADYPVTESFKLFAAYEGGPWLTFSGVVIETVRFTVRARTLVRMSVRWRAAAVLEQVSDPSWSIVTDPDRRVTSDSCTIKIDDVAHTQGVDATLEIRDPKDLVNLGADGVATGWSRLGTQAVVGSVVEIYDPTHDLPAIARGLTETSLYFKLAAQAEPTYYVEATLPRVVWDEANPAPMGEGDVAETASFRAVQPAGLGVAELTLVATTP